MNQDIQAYNNQQTDSNKAICDLLADQLQQHLTGATSKIWHRGPVWFIADNPVAGYFVRKNDVQLLFWSGQSFDELGLKPEGSFKAAEANYTDVTQVALEDLKRWLASAITIQWDYKNIVKRKGVLERLV